MRTPPRSRRRVLLRLLLAVVAALLVGLVAGPAGAHTALAGSEPAAGAVVSGPVRTITLEFTKPVDAVPGGVTLLDAAGEEIAIDSVAVAEGTRLEVVPSRPLDAGEFGLRWSARAVEDGHVLDGSLSFRAEAPATAPVAGTAADRAAEAQSGPQSEPRSRSLASALAARPSTTTATLVGWLARLLVYATVLFTVGGIVYLRFVHEGSAFETRRIVFWIRRSALVLVAATGLRALALLARGHQGSFLAVLPVENWGHTFGGDTGIGLALAAAGGCAVLLGLRITLSSTTRELPLDAGAVPAARWSTDEVVGLSEQDGGSPGDPGAVATRTALVRVRTTRLRLDHSPIALAGAAAIVASSLFLGHTVSEGPRLLTASVDVAHLGAASVWFGGVVLLAAALWRRRRDDDGLPGGLLVARFARIAAAAIVVVSLAGVVLAAVILPDVSALWTTAFGRIVVAKVLLVGVLAALGADNHFRTVPRLEADPVDASALGRLRRTVAAESVVLAAVVALTAALVVSSPT